MAYRIRWGFVAAVSMFIISLVTPAAAELRPVESRFRLSYESIDMPVPDKRMGLVGFHYLVDLHPNWYAGLGGFGSIKGDRGGFFTGGLTGGVQKNITGNLWFDAGLFAGAGGGGGAPQGSGLMLRPYAGLIYDFDAVRLGFVYSRVDFPKTAIDSNHVAVTLDLPFTNYFSGSHNGSATSALADLDAETGQTPGFVQQEILFLIRAYTPTGSVRNTTGQLTDERIDLIGAQYRHFINANAYLLGEALGAFGGNVDGYAEVLFGGGYRLPLTSGGRLRLNMNLALGAGGGGTVDVGGGGLARGEAGLEFRISPTCFAALGGGYIDSFNGSFEATIIGAEIGFSMENLSSTFGSVPQRSDDEFIWNRWRIRVSHLTYTAPERKMDAGDDKAMHLLGAKIDHFLNEHLYLTGQAAGAYAGDAGGYAIGLVGTGIQSGRLGGSGFRLSGELLVGAAGGGGIDVGDGAVWQPMAGLEYDINDAFSLQAMAGLIKAIDGNLDSPVFDISLSWRFASLGRKIK